MALLAEQQPDAAPQPSTSEADNDEISQPQEGGYGGISSEQLEEQFRKQMNDKQQHNFDQWLDAGNDLLFGKDTHYQLMDQLQNSQDIAADLGNGAFGLMSVLIKKALESNRKEDISDDVILPAGVVLICRASEFLNESGVAKVSDDDLEKATNIFGVKMMHTFSPEYRDKLQQSQQPQEQPQDQMAQQPPQQGGMLDMTGAQ